jgi:hypothetical protein
LQTEEAKNSATLENRLVQDLPLEVAGSVRTPFNLAAISPDAKNLGGATGFSIGRGQAAAYGASLDGISANTSRALYTNTVSSNAPSVEAIDQFSVDSAGYKAEFGHAAGIKGKLPQDVEAYRHNKIGGALDVSHVQLSRYMSSADYALREAMAGDVSRFIEIPATTKTTATASAPAVRKSGCPFPYLTAQLPPHVC